MEKAGVMLRITAQQCRNGHADCLNELILDTDKKGARNGNQHFGTGLDKDGKTALFEAARSGHTACLKPLVKAGADVNITDKWNTTALDEAIFNRHVDFVRELIAEGANVNTGGSGTAPILKSIKAGSIHCVEELLKAEADINVTDEDGNTPLMTAANVGNESVVQLLLDKGADVNLKNKKGETALYHAVDYFHEEFQKTQSTELSVEAEFLAAHTNIVYAILQGGASVNNNLTDLISEESLPPHILKMLGAAGMEFKEPKLFISEESLQDLARKSIRKHLKRIHQDENLYCTVPQLGLPPRLQSYLLFYTLQKTQTNRESKEKDLLLRAAKNDAEGVLSLLETGVDVNVQDENGMTALMLVSQNGQPNLVEKIATSGASVNIKANFGDTALIFATKQKQKRLHAKTFGIWSKPKHSGRGWFHSLDAFC